MSKKTRNGIRDKEALVKYSNVEPRKPQKLLD